MNIAKPWTVTVIEDCHGLDHSKCAGKQEKPDITLICSCRCHHNNEKENTVTNVMEPVDVDASRSLGRWSEEDTRFLVENASMGANALAKALNRTPEQVRGRARTLNLSLRREGSKAGRRKAVKP